MDYSRMGGARQVSGQPHAPAALLARKEPHRTQMIRDWEHSSVDLGVVKA
jgi:hypothetical protein